MGSVGGGNKNTNSALTEAIQAYTAIGGEKASKYPYTADKAKLLLEAMSNNEYVTRLTSQNPNIIRYSINFIATVNLM